ncbi:MAG: UDP-N-acetylglucosamine 2-epimerase (non-hydrolyzing) [Gammaproteobacteria bacterium]|nr:UDP-N-acetylglucosamine 2-epimerase (non-hydrolyzing) [Gammaproteobacteria bacterium]
MKKRLLLVLGTRPEAIKLAPVYQALRARSTYDVRLASTGQHREMLADALATFDIAPDYDLALMRDAQNQSDLLSAMLPRLSEIFATFPPDCVVVQGDTATTYGAALAAYLNRVTLAHVEAGLRTGDKFAPFPEEGYRRMVACLADLHFAPTLQARRNLLAESIPDSRIWVTGNTAIDAIRWVLANTSPIRTASLRFNFDSQLPRFILVTCHRRESFGGELRSIMTAIANLAKEFASVPFIFPVHLNPQVQQASREILRDLPNVHLCSPLDYRTFAHLLNACHFVMTDSGGIQEEAADLGKPVLVMRRTTERCEGVAAGTALLAGVDSDEIQQLARRLLVDETFYQSLAVPAKIYGNGDAADQIATILDSALVSSTAPG